MINVKDFGAVGDGIVKDTSSIQKAIDSGNHVYFPAGTYLCGSLYLHSNSFLELEQGAVILGSGDPEDYNKGDFCPQNGVCIQEKAYGGHLIIALECEYVSIRGGRIDGNREAFFDPAEGSRDQFQEYRPSQMLFFCESSHITLENVVLTNSPYWACFLHGCSDVRISGVKVRNQEGVWNGDGLDIDCCRRVIVSDCNIESSDDSLTIRASARARLKYNKEGICEDIAVTNCILKSGQAAIRVGVGTGTIRRCVLSNISVRGSLYGICMLSTYLPKIFPKGAEGVQIEDILFSDMIIHARIPVDISANWVDAPLQSSMKNIQAVTLRNIRAYGSETCIFQGNDDRKLNDILVSDCDFVVSGGENIREDSSGKHPYGCRVYQRACAFYAVNVKKLVFRSCSICFRNESEKWQETIRIADDSNIVFNACTLEAPRNGVVCRKELAR